MAIEKSTTLCEDSYFLPDGLTIKSNVILDCANSFIYGEDREKVGLTIIREENVTILNCNFGFYEKGIYSRDSHTSPLTILFLKKIG